MEYCITFETPTFNLELTLISINENLCVGQNISLQLVRISVSPFPAKRIIALVHFILGQTFTCMFTSTSVSVIYNRPFPLLFAF